MSYVVLARRYRPQVFSDLVGQEHVTHTLKNALRLGRTAHAYLFTGPRGVGKTSAARIFAKALRCLEPTADYEPCNKCLACTSVNDGNSMDVLEIDAASNTGVDNIRELRENVGYMASIGKYRIYIIDEVHMLSTAAFNALLKTLEEPPPHVVFIFATTEIHKVLPTIQSRCQRFDFKKLNNQTMTANLREICVQEKVEIDDASIRTIVFESEGCLRDAQSLLDQAIALCGNQVKINVLEEALGMVDRASFLELVSCVGDHEPGKVLKLSAAVMNRGVDPKILIGRCVDFFRDLHYRTFTNENPTDDDSWNDALAQLQKKLSPDEVVRALDLALRCQTQLHSTVNSSMLLESFLVKLCLQRPVGSPDNQGAERESSSSRGNTAPVSRAPIRQSAPVSAAPTPAMTTSVAAPNPGPASVATNSGTFSLSTLEQYIHQNKPAWVPVLQTILSIEEQHGTLHVRAKSDFAGKRLASSDGIEVLKIAYKVPKATVELQVAAAAAPVASPAQRIHEKRQQAKDHDAVKAAIRMFDAVVTETKILEDGDAKR